MFRRWALPVLLVLVAIGCGVAAVQADAGGETAEATDEVTSPVTPVLSARRVPELVTADIAKQPEKKRSEKKAAKPVRKKSSR